MNYINIVKSMWTFYQGSALEPNEYCLMMRLIAISNDDMGWGVSFMRNNYELMGTTKLSFKQFSNSRNKLKQIGLISFVQPNGVPNCRYTLHFDTLLNLSKKVKGGAEVTQTFGEGEGIGEGEDKLNQTKPNQTTSFPGASPPGEKNKPKTPKPEPFWAELVEIWHNFYLEKFKTAPVINDVQAKTLKKIVSALKQIAKSAKKEWNEDFALRSMKRFLQLAWDHDDWLKHNFELTNLLTKFNSITNSNAKPSGQTSATRNQQQSSSRETLLNNARGSSSLEG